MARIELALLGGFAVIRADGTAVGFDSNKARALLAYLALERDRAHSREELCGLLWPDYSPEAAQNNLRNTLSGLRDSLGEREAQHPLLLVTRENVRALPDGDIKLDLWTFLDGGGVEEYRGAFLQGFSLPDSAPFESWLERARARLAEEAQARLGRLAEAAERSGEYDLALRWARRRLELEPWREEAHCQAMRALALKGERSAALAQYETCKRELDEELGVDPDEETDRLRDAIQRGDTGSLRSGEPLPAPGDAPFKGLYCFEEKDAEIFFGRERLAERLARRVREMGAQDSPRLLAVVGASGSGKSSLARAGIAPLLKSWGEGVALLTPGAKPLEMLQGLDAAALWVIDQFEEVFTLCRQEEERAAFIERLLEQAERGPGVVLALRADFYANCAHYPRLREALGARQEYIGPMSAEELRRAVEAPAARGGWRYEAGLVELILRDVGSEPGALPLLQHALLETWKRRRGKQMTLTGYAEAGGVHGAIARTADRVFHELGETERELARRVFLRLTELGEGAQDTRRRATLEDLTGERYERGEIERLLGRLAAARLVTLSEGAAEVAHEALIREWPALREWLSQDREGLRLQRHIGESAAAWDRLGRDEGELYRGARLAQALEWAERGENADALNRLEGEFLAASRERGEREAMEAEEARQRELEAARRLAESETRAARRLRLRAWLLAGAFILALVFVALAVWQGQVARANELQAENSAALAFARELAAQSSARLESEPDLSTLLALQAVKTLRDKGLAVPYDVQQAVHDVAILSRLVWYRQMDVIPWEADFLPGDKGILFYDGNTTAHFIDLASAEEIPYLDEQTNHQVTAFDISLDNRFLLFSFKDRTEIWDYAARQKLLTLPDIKAKDDFWLGGAEFSSDGQMVISADGFGNARVWDLRPWLAKGAPAGETLNTPYQELGCSITTFLGLDMTLDRKWASTVCPDENRIYVWDVESGRAVHTLENTGDAPFDADFSPDGRYLAVGNFWVPFASVWDLESGSITAQLAAGPLTAVEFSPDNTLLGVTGKRTIVYDTANWQELYRLPGRGNTLFLHFKRDSRSLIMTSEGGGISIWDTTRAGRGELISEAQSAERAFVHTSPDGRWLYETLNTGQLVLRSGEDLKVKERHDLYPGQAFYGLFSRDGSRFISTSADQEELTVWDASTWQPVAKIPLAPAWHVSYALDSAGDLATVVTKEQKIQVYSLAENKVLATLDVDSGYILYETMLSPDGNWLIAAGDVDESGGGGKMTVWDVSKGFAGIPPGKTVDIDTRAETHQDFSPDGTRIVACGLDQHGEVFDLATATRVLFLNGITSRCKTIHYSPDGHYIVAAAEDNYARVWDASSGALLLSYPQPVPGVMDFAAFTADSSRVIAAGDSGYYFQFAFRDIDQLLEIVRGRVVRDWRPEECQLYLHRETCPEGR